MVANTAMTTDERTQVLHRMGFVHITGLPIGPWGETDHQENVQPAKRHLGKWDCNNGKTVVVTPEGEVWLMADFPKRGDEHWQIQAICPNGQGAFVPCSNGEVIHSSYLLERFRNPRADWEGRHSPIPQVIEC